MEIQYPCIVYQLDNVHTEFAGNRPYFRKKRYQITVIDKDPNSLIPDTVGALESAAFDRHFTANNLHHSVYTLYY